MMELHQLLEMSNTEHQHHRVVLTEAIQVLADLEGYFPEDECDWINLAQVYMRRVLRKVEQIDH